ncbi:MAG: twin-arginine translocase subunit TatC [Chromatiaceae bacterium]|nr:twin-arginine translocase subunit TatC [Gammaproteobacteria bacterium]MCB1879285.1 twin-arginine translocase subunit TatC [Gammaproteobacteria bacterium]MCB1903123.1 twin-arginine translocase subunit TatC [Gammaproteobacteria bacterium]MCP5426670.1 twin-arginine translocase subunit TatC [Chromatiaceae bacterium]MCP5446486.1 twin-arginine translocase subunit TatC [Chromatiaceae bacterium]
MTNQNDPASDSFKEQPFVSHLLELRDRLLRALAVVAVFFLCLFPFANDIYIWVASPLMAHLPVGTSMIATEVASPFLTPFKLSLVAAFFLSIPYTLYQMWAFIAPGLYTHEKRLVLPLVASSTLLFYVGMLFAYYVVFPLVFAFLTGTVPDGVTVATDIAKYLDFILTLFFAFGMAFEVPIATFILVWMGVTTPDKLVEKRPYIIVGAFLLGMLLTPPDVISQTLLAVPMWLLFEAGVIASRLFGRRLQEGRRAAESGDNAAPKPVAQTAAAASAAARSPADPGDEFIVFDGDPSPDGPKWQPDPDRFVPLTEEEMDAELDVIEAEEAAADGEDNKVGGESGSQADLSVERKLRKVQQLRDDGDGAGARKLLYEILTEGDADQVNVAKNILQQLDSD